MKRAHVAVLALLALALLAGCTGAPSEESIEDAREDTVIISVEAEDGTPCYVLLDTDGSPQAVDCIEGGSAASDF